MLAVRTKLRAKKLWRSLTGKSVTIWAQRNLVAGARLHARLKERAKFRKERPPYWACPTCTATFGLYRPYRRHYMLQCPETGDNELHPRLKRA